MAVESIAQLVALLVAVLGIIWHQQHNTDKLRGEMISNGQRLARITDKLRDEVISNGQRLARIEGFLRIGMPAPADAGSAETPAPEPASAPSAPAPEIEAAADK